MRNLIIALFVIASSTVIGQNKNNGFLGKTNFVDVTSVSYVPILPNLFNSDQGYKAVGSSLRAKTNPLFNTGFRVSLGRAFKRNFGMSIESGMDFYEATVRGDMTYDKYDNYYNGYYYEGYYFRRHENLDIRVFHIMPKIHIANSSSLLPMGLSHEIGIGVAMSSIADKDYVSQFMYNDGFSNETVASPDPKEYIDFSASYRSLQFLYGIKMRTPISKVLFINYGFRYTVEFKLGDNYPTGNKEVTTDLTDKLMVNYNLRLLANVASFDLGLSFAF